LDRICDTIRKPERETWYTDKEENKMKLYWKKKLTAAAALVLALLTLVGCSGGRSVKKTAKLERPAMEVGSKFEDYVIPWYLDASAEAKEAGTLDFYFMSINNMPFGEDSSEPGKWGDSCLIVFPNGETMLIDGGEGEYAVLLQQNLKYLGVEKIDHLVFSHPHSDHCYGIVGNGGLLENFEVGHAYYNGMYNIKWGDPQIIENKTAALGIPLTLWKEGDTAEIGGVSIEVLGPDETCAGRESAQTDTINNNSLLLRFDYNEFSALFTGDLYAKAEMDYVMDIPEKLDVDLLKIPHHGHETSSTTAFIKVVSPEVAVATGNVEMPGNVYNDYKRYDTDVYLDYADGYIFVSTDGKKMNVETSHERNTDIYDKYDK